MRDAKRIDTMLRAVREVWELEPDWRLGQLIINVLGGESFHMEDEDALKRLISEADHIRSSRPVSEDPQ